MRARMLAAFLLIISFNILILGVSLGLGYNSSRKYWNYLVEQESEKILKSILDNLMEQEGTLSKENSHRVLAGARDQFLGIAQIHMFSREGALLESWLNRNLDNYLPVPADPASARPLYYKGNLMGFVQMAPAAFRNFEFNRLFVTRLIRLAFSGMFLSMGLSFLLAYRISGHFTQEARNTARSLINLADGSRNEVFRPTITLELESINKAAVTLQERLIREETQRSRWSESIAHDLRTPITAMKSQFTACRDGILPMTTERWDILLLELGRMEALVKDFSFMARLESADFKLNTQTVRSLDIKQYLDGSINHMAREKDIRLNWDFPELSIKCDFTLLATALTHLVRNAVQHSPSGSTVRITLTGDGDHFLFGIENPGQIDEKDLPHLFEPLFKTDTSRRQTGSGLGLTISRLISRIHNGELTVRNLPENTVRFDLSVNSCNL